MRIAISSAGKNWFGSEILIATLARGLRRRGHEVVLFCGRRTPLWKRLRDELPCEPVVQGFDLNPVTLWRIRRAIRRFEPELVVVQMNKDLRFTGVVARLLDIPVILRWEIDRAFPARKPYHRLLYGWIPIHQIAPSEMARNTMLDAAPWLPPERVSVIYNGIDFPVFSEGERAVLPVPEGGLAVGFVGRMEARKGVLEVAAMWPQVAAAVPGAHLVMVGTGELEAELRSRLANAPRVHWLGFRDDIPAIMRALDVLLVPSHYEGFGLVVAEAMAARTPVIATRASNFPELITDGVDGRLVTPRDPGSLGGALIELLQQPVLRERIAARGQERARRDFAIEPMLERHELLFAEVIEEHARRRATAA